MRVIRKNDMTILIQAKNQYDEDITVKVAFDDGKFDCIYIKELDIMISDLSILKTFKYAIDQALMVQTEHDLKQEEGKGENERA